MARSSKTVLIGRNEYKLLSLGASKGAELWLDLLRILATPLEHLAKAENVDEGALMQAIAATLRALDQPTAAKFFAAFGPLSTVRIPGMPGEPDRWPTLEGAVFDEHFANNYVEMTEWLVQSVAFNFFGFFGDGSLGTLVERFRATTSSLTSTTT